MSNTINMIAIKPDITMRSLAGAGMVRTANCVISDVKCDAENTLESFYKAIDCDLIDMITFNMNGKEVSVAFDDHGLFRVNTELGNASDGRGYVPGWTVTDDDGDSFNIPGTLVFHGVDDEGGTANSPINEDDIRNMYASGRIRPVLLMEMA
jgi:hypothetical protein